MFTTLLLSTALALSSAQPAPISSERFHDPEASYVRTVAKDGTVTLTGQDQRTGMMFRYTIKDGVVRGWVGNQAVSFPLSQATSLRR